MKHVISSLFEVILKEYLENPVFRKNIEDVIKGAPAATKIANSGKQRNRRTRAIVDPYEVNRIGETALRHALAPLTIDQLKDVISEFAIDSSKLALKWKDRDRLINLIVVTTKARIEKGDAFRS
ncbi:MAG TPA: hypothetical protein VK572_17565 [Burkholderiales bacterium]|nr:hypothetical protein [Burkholderiales bacterium]